MNNDAKKIIQTSFIWDGHTCISLHPKASISEFEAHHQAGFDYVSVNVGMDMISVEQVVAVIASFSRQIQQHPQMMLAKSVADIDIAKAQNKLSISFDLEGALTLLPTLAIDKTPDFYPLLDMYYELGVRQIHMAYNRNNIFCGGCYDDDVPLSAQGKALVQAINAKGILMDMSHTGYQSSLDIMEFSSKPAIFSHANVRHFNDNLRNVSDEQIKVCAAQEGVIGVNGVEKFLGIGHDYDQARLANEIDSLHGQAMAEQVDYIANLVGIDYVGIGLDYVYQRDLNELDDVVDVNYWWPPTHGYNTGLAKSIYASPCCLAYIVECLMRFGYDEISIKKVLGNNFKRVAESVWQ